MYLDVAESDRFGLPCLLNNIIIEIRAATSNVRMQMEIGLGLALGLARFVVWRLAQDVQIQMEIGLGLTLGLARFDGWRLAPDVQIREAIGLALALGLARSGLVWLGSWKSIIVVGGESSALAIVLSPACLGGAREA